MSVAAARATPPRAGTWAAREPERRPRALSVHGAPGMGETLEPRVRRGLPADFGPEDFGAEGARDTSIWAARCVATRRNLVLVLAFEAWAGAVEDLVQFGKAELVDDEGEVVSLVDDEGEWPGELLEWRGPWMTANHFV